MWKNIALVWVAVVATDNSAIFAQSGLRLPQDKQTPSKTIIIERETRPVVPPPSALVLDPRTGEPMRFRVVVPIATDQDLVRIRTVIPDAFRSVRDGRLVAQIGAYSDRPSADAQAQKVIPLGFQAVIMDF